MKERILYLLKTYVWTVLVFIGAKIAFMLFCREGHAFTVGDVYEVVIHGLTLDLSTALYFLIVPFLISLASLWMKIPRWLNNGYFLLISIAITLAFVADTSLYPYWGFKLDASCLQYLETPTEAMASVSTGYIFVRLFILVLLVLLVFLGYTRPKVHFHPTRHRIAGSVAALFAVPLIVIGIRGGIGESTTNIGQVFYSQNQFLNHAAVNPVFSFLYSLSHQMGDTSEYEFFSTEKCNMLAEDVYTTESIQTDTLLTTRQPNIVVILMEGAGETFAQAMPYLQQLKQEGISFTQCYGNSWRTDRGTVCTLSGYPSFPALSVMKMPEKSRTLPSIARSLQQEGYQTVYLYGGDINFTNMRSYLVSTGWERIISMNDFTVKEQHTGQWGVRDDITFQRLAGIVQECYDARQHYLVGFSTLSSHEPWDVPVKTHDDEVLNAFAYLDRCLKDFIERLRQTPQWKDLLIVLLPDHGINYRDIDTSKPVQKNHIPMVWVGGAVRAPRQVDVICNQSDLAASLLGQLRLPHKEYTFSRDVLSKTYHYPTAVHNYNNAQMLMDSTGYIVYDIDAHQLTASQPADGVSPASDWAERMLLIDKAILQVTTNDLKKR